MALASETSPPNIRATQLPGGINPPFNGTRRSPSPFMSSELQHGHSTSHRTIINLHSTCFASSAIPETFSLAISHGGKWIMASNSSHLYLIDAEQLPRLSARAFKVHRRPIAVDALDDGSLLCILSSEHKVDIFRISADNKPDVSRLRTIYLVRETHSITISPDGQILATSNDMGIEVISLVSENNGTDRRGISCDAVENLSFADDSRTLLATASASHSLPSTVFSVHGSFDDFFTEDSDCASMNAGKSWVTQLVFPKRAIPASQSVLLSDASVGGPIKELFAFDENEQTWGLFDLTLMNFTEHMEFPGDVLKGARQDMLESAFPAISLNADRVAVAVKSQEQNCSVICLYNLSKFFRDGNCESSLCNGQPESQFSECTTVRISDVSDEAESSLQGISGLRWLRHKSQISTEHRLLALWESSKRLALNWSSSVIPVNGTIVIIDFFSNSKKNDEPISQKTTLNLDDIESESLPEQELHFEEEVAAARRRAAVQRYLHNKRRGTGLRDSYSGQSFSHLYRRLRDLNEQNQSEENPMEGVALTMLDVPNDHTSLPQSRGYCLNNLERPLLQHSNAAQSVGLQGQPNFADQVPPPPYTSEPGPSDATLSSLIFPHDRLSEQNISQSYSSTLSTPYMLQHAPVNVSAGYISPFVQSVSPAPAHLPSIHTELQQSLHGPFQSLRFMSQRYQHDQSIAAPPPYSDHFVPNHSVSGTVDAHLPNNYSSRVLGQPTTNPAQTASPTTIAPTTTLRRTYV